MKVLRITLLIFLLCFSVSTGYSNVQAQDAADDALIKKAAAIHDKVFTIDTHTDTPMGFGRGYNPGERHNSREGGGKVDFPRMKDGGLDAVFFAAFVGQGKRTPEAFAKVKSRVLSVFAHIHKATADNSDVAAPAYTSEDGYKIEKTGKRAVYIGIENGYAIGKDIKLVKQYYDLGTRYITLCHTGNNDICDSSTGRGGPEHNGVSEFGKEVIAEMNKLGIMIDVSHISDKSFFDVVELSKTPVIASHSCARAICESPRNMTDDMLKKLAKNGGVIQMCILSSYVKKPEPNPERDAAFQKLREKFTSDMTKKERDEARAEWRALGKKFPRKLATVSDAVDHIDHIIKVAGIDHVGIGTDFDGGGGLKDCYDVSEMGNITLEMVKRGYTEEQIRKIWGGNVMRVFKEVERIAKESQTETE